MWVGSCGFHRLNRNITDMPVGSTGSMGTFHTGLWVPQTDREHVGGGWGNIWLAWELAPASYEVGRHQF